MLTRPPPLQLVFDNTRPGLRPASRLASIPRPQSQSPVVKPPKPKSLAQVGVFAAQVYRANWRNFVIAIAAINAFRFIASGHPSTMRISTSAHVWFPSRLTVIRGLHGPWTDHMSKLAQISLALGALYLFTALIQIFGAISTALQRPKLIHTYVYLAFLAALLISTAGFITGIEYFLLARGKIRHGQIPNTKVAQEQCHTAWSHGSVSQVFGIFAFSAIPAVIFFLLAYTYYRQTTDPTHSAYLHHKNSDVAYVRMEAYPNHNGSTYNDTQNLNANGNGNDNDATILRARTPRMQNSNQNGAAALLQQSTMIHTTNDSPYGVSPGPPSYAPLRGTYGYGEVWFGGARR
ncbi:hypothetical protein C0995_001672 [Termitomyces sp. Mi166|nr:hypothetical protein C0995_001672 [Termitomyces sp. Mi166\